MSQEFELFYQNCDSSMDEKALMRLFSAEFPGVERVRPRGGGRGFVRFSTLKDALHAASLDGKFHGYRGSPVRLVPVQGHRFPEAVWPPVVELRAAL